MYPCCSSSHQEVESTNPATTHTAVACHHSTLTTAPECTPHCVGVCTPMAGTSPRWSCCTPHCVGPCNPILSKSPWELQKGACRIFLSLIVRRSDALFVRLNLKTVCNIFFFCYSTIHLIIRVPLHSVFLKQYIIVITIAGIVCSAVYCDTTGLIYYSTTVFKYKYIL